jgi:hypothetical protein
MRRALSRLMDGLVFTLISLKFFMRKSIIILY